MSTVKDSQQGCVEGIIFCGLGVFPRDMHGKLTQLPRRAEIRHRRRLSLDLTGPFVALSFPEMLLSTILKTSPRRSVKGLMSLMAVPAERS